MKQESDEISTFLSFATWRNLSCKEHMIQVYMLLNIIYHRFCGY